MPSPLLLIVEPTPALARALSRRISATGWRTLSAASVDEARDLLGRLTFDAWVVDQELGEEALRLVREHDDAGRARPKTALWTSGAHDPPEDAGALGVAVFRELDVDALLAWLERPVPSTPPSRPPSRRPPG